MKTKEELRGEILKLLDTAKHLSASIELNSVQEKRPTYGSWANEEFISAFREKYTPWVEQPSGDHIGWMIRVSNKSGKSPLFTGFDFPTTGYCEALNFAPAGSNGGGIYGLLDGVGDWGLIPASFWSVWQIVAVDRREVVLSNAGGTQDDLKPVYGSVRAPRGWVTFTGTMEDAIELIKPHMRRRQKLGDNWFIRAQQFWDSASCGEVLRNATEILNATD